MRLGGSGPRQGWVLGGTGRQSNGHNEQALAGDSIVQEQSERFIGVQKQANV